MLQLRIKTPFRARIGSLGVIGFRKGLYLYVGSAKRGYSRVRRHLSKEKKLRWHIDYLTIRSDVEVEKVYLVEVEEDVGENNIVSLLIKEGAPVTIKGFGSSDDKFSQTHLLGPFKSEEEINRIILRLIDGLKKPIVELSPRAFCSADKDLV